MKLNFVGTVEVSLLYLASHETEASYMASEAGGDIPKHKREYVHQTVLFTMITRISLH